MSSMPLTFPKRLQIFLLLSGLFLLALMVRWRDLAAASALGDALGPYLVGWSAPLGVGRPHAPPYGWGLSLPYGLILSLSSSLWQAFAGLQLLHSLVPPLMAWAAIRRDPRRWWLGALLGLFLALDPGWVHASLSGSKGYLAGLWLSLMCLLLTSESARWSSLAGPAWAMAVMNHPYALAALPQLVLIPKRGRPAAALSSIVLLAPRMLRALTEPALGFGSEEVTLLEATLALGQESGPTVWIWLLLPLGLWLTGLRDAWVRASLLSILALVLLALLLGYVRDYHLRLLILPAMLTLTAIPGRWGALLLLTLRWPASELPPPDHPHRPGTLGLSHQLTSSLEELAQQSSGRLALEGVQLGGSLAAEPSALLLDLVLRGLPVERLGPGGELLILVSGDRALLSAYRSQQSWLVQGDRHLLGEASDAVCPVAPARIEGGWQALAVMRPELTLESGPLWGCSSDLDRQDD